MLFIMQMRLPWTSQDFRHVEPLQLALTEAEEAGLEDRDIHAAKRALQVALAVAEAATLVDQDVLAAKLAVEAEQRKASGQPS